MGKQRFQIEFDFEANMGQVKSSVEDLKKSLTGISMPQNLAANFEKLFGKLEQEMSEFQALTKDGFTDMADVKKAQSAFSKISKTLNQLGIESAKIKGIDPNKLIPKQAQAQIGSLQKKLAELQKQQEKKDSYAEKINKQTRALKEQESAISKLKTRRNALEKTNADAKTAKKNAATSKTKSEKRKATVVAEMTALEGQKGGKSTAEYKNLSAELATLNKTISSNAAEFERLTTQINKNKAMISTLDGQIDTAERSFSELQDELNRLKSIDVDPESLQTLRKELASITGLRLNQVPTDLAEIQQTIDGINAKHLKEVEKNLAAVATNVDKVDDAADGAKDGMNNFVDSAKGMDDAAKEVDNLKNNFLQFFSLTNSIQLFKRGIQSALNTVKELDATMTEAAVVTDFDVGGMWDRLPQYSAQAQQLGTSINSMYEATTLYYQQGLKTNQAMQLGTETMKMAKIAGMESAQATEAMTAALRGFNMELNETSAVRVNDVYSQLAAVTAADTEQIATAMEKTASIAASANMEFETTAALLAQIIETTQEAPETAGTAMKTIIARFSEVKNLRSQGQMTGTDSEGEALDVNKIQTALSSVGISMQGFFSGAEGLDSILLKLAEKWNTLDFETQRYIATTAAGSRQQSRFIAMMSDYARTTKLVGEAQNSAGASSKQFTKTQDSMETKMQKLSNAWDEFLMGLANNKILKGAVTVLTSLLETINKLVGGVSGGNGLAKTFVSLTLAITALKVGKTALTGVTGKLTKSFRGLGKSADDASKNMQNADNTTQKLGKSTTQGASGVNGMATSLTNVAQKTFIAGAAVSLLGGLFQAFGWDNAAEGAQIVGMALMGLSGVLMIVSVATNITKESFKKLWATMAPILPYLLAIAAAVAVVIAIVTSLNKAYQDAEKELEDLNKALEEVGKRADEAKEKLEELGKARTELDDMSKKLKELTRGTQEWKEALIQANEKVLALLDTYPQLAAYIERGANGELTIQDEGWEMATQLQQEEVVNTSTAKMAIQGQIAKKSLEKQMRATLAKTYAQEQGERLGWSQNKIDREITRTEKKAARENKRITRKLGKDKGYSSTDAAVLGGLNSEQYNKFAAEAAKRGLSMAQGSTKDEFLTVFKDLKLDEDKFETLWDQMNEVGTAFDEIANSANAVVIAEQARVKAIATTIALESEKVQASEDFGKAATDLTAAFSQDYSARISEIAGEYADDYKANKKSTKKKNKAFIETYAAEMGLDAADVKARIDENELTYSSMANEMAAKQVNEELTKTMEDLVDALETATQGGSKKSRQILARTMSDDFSSVYVGDVATIKGPKGSGTFSEYLQTMGVDLSQLAAGLGKTEQELIDHFNNNWDGIERALSDAYNEDTFGFGEEIEAVISGENGMIAALAGLGVESDLTIRQVETLAGALANVKLGSGNMEKTVSYFDDLLIGIQGKDLQTAYEMLVETDWDSQFAINNTITALREMGAVIRQDVVNEIYDATDAIADISLDQIQNQFANAKTLRDAVSEQIEAGTKVFTEDQAGELVSTYGLSWDDFVYTEEGEYTYIGEDTNFLLTRILEDTDAMARQMGASKREAVERGEKIKAWEDDMWSTDGTRITWSTLQKDSTYVGLTDEKAALIDNAIKGERAAAKEEKEEPTWGEKQAAAAREGIQTAGNLLKKLPSWMTNNTALETVIDAAGGIEEEAKEKAEDAKAQAEKEARDQENKAIDSLIKNGKITEEEAGAYKKRKAGGNSVSDEDMRAIAAAWGIEPEKYEGLSGQTLLDFLTKYYNEYLLKLPTNQAELDRINQTILDQALFRRVGTAELFSFAKEEEIADSEVGRVLDGYINKTAGLGVTVERATWALKQQNAEFAKNGNAVKNLVATNHRANESMDSLLSAITESIDGFRAGTENILEYEKALGKIIPAAKKVFGEKADRAFIETHKGLFEALALGGEAAEGAYRQLGYEAAKQYVEGLKSGVGVATVMNIVANSKIQDLKPGEVFNANSVMEELMQAGMKEEQAIEFLDLRGYTITIDHKVDGSWEASGMVESPWGNGLTEKIEEPEEWENPYDKQYNYVQKINAELEKREALERRYQRLINQNKTSIDELNSIKQQELASYEAEKALRERVRDNRIAEISNIYDKYSDVAHFAYWDEELGKVQLNQEALDALDRATGEEAAKRGEEVEKYISALEEQSNLIQEEKVALDEINDGVWEIYTRGKDQYLELETRIKDALVESYQTEIDKLSEVHDAIEDTNAKLLDAIQEQIDAYREVRDNEKTEEELKDKQRKISYLSMDTSGANALEILQLQKELDEGIESYTDQLVDQKISELQRQNDFAAEQRQHQIDLLQAQLDNYSASKDIWDEVHNLIKTGTDANGNLLNTSALKTLLGQVDQVAGMSKIKQMEWLQGLETDVSTALSWLQVGAPEFFLKTGAQVTAIGKDGKTYSGIINESGDLQLDWGVIRREDLSIGTDSKVYAQSGPVGLMEDTMDEDPELKPYLDELFGSVSDWLSGSTTATGASKNSAGAPGENEKRGVSAAILAGSGGWGSGATRKKRLAEVFGEGNNVQSQYINNQVSSGYTGSMSDYSYEKMKKRYIYKTGGLADFTGPAWLDGTKSRPEYVLNATQTKAFLSLVDVMASLKSSPKPSNTTENSGDNLYDIDINVESIGSDYSVEQMAETIKRLIVEDAQYRNNNAINLSR